MEDLISQLPNDLLHKILLNLTTIESVRTSVLSTRWRHLWQNVPGLMLKGYERDLPDFMEKFLNSHEELPIYQFIISCLNVDIPCWKFFIDQILSRRVQLLRIRSRIVPGWLRMITLPISFYTCETLVNLHLEHVKLDDFDGSEFVNLPRLQAIHLEYVSIPNDVGLEMLILCSPALQYLRVSSMRVGRMKLRSQTLKSLSLKRICKEEYKLLGDSGECRVVIDTPNLEFLVIRYDPLENFKVESVSSSIKICIGHRDFSNMQIFHKFFVRILQVTDLSISTHTLYTVYKTYSKVQQHQQLPEFKNLTRLCACLLSSFAEMFSVFLSSCPNLKCIDLELECDPNTMDKIVNSPVPQCLQTSIDNVKIKLMARERKAEIEFAKYILENARALKKFTFCLDEKEDVCSSVLEQILPFRYRPSVEVKIRRERLNYRLGFIFDRPYFF